MICVYIYIYTHTYIYAYSWGYYPTLLITFMITTIMIHHPHDSSPWFVIMIHHHICIIMTPWHAPVCCPFYLNQTWTQNGRFSMTFHGMFPWHGFRWGPTWWAPPHSSCHYLLEPDKSPGRQHESHQWNCRGKTMRFNEKNYPPGKPTYPTIGKRKIIDSKCHFWGDVLVPWRVVAPQKNDLQQEKDSSI